MENNSEKYIVLSDKCPLICTPCYGNMLTNGYFMSMIKLIAYLNVAGVRYGVHSIGNESLVTRARNESVAYFLANKQFTHLFFIDADITFKFEDFAQVLFKCTEERGVVVGAYPKKGLPIQYAINFSDKDGKINLVDGVFKVNDGGCGFMCIHRSVFEKMMIKFPEMQYTPYGATDPNYKDGYNSGDYKDCSWAFFNVGFKQFGEGIKDKFYLSEDYFFCTKWREAGGDIWLFPFAKLDHTGSYTFEGNIENIMELDNE